MTTLDSLSAGEWAEVLRIDADVEVKERLKMLNVFCGSKIRLLKKCFFGQSLLIGADGVRAGLRKNLAKNVYVRKLGTDFVEDADGSGGTGLR